MSARLPAVTTDDRAAPLFDDDFLETLEYLHIVARKILSGQMKAERRSRQKGVSVEFATCKGFTAAPAVISTSNVCDKRERGSLPPCRRRSHSTCS